MRRTGTAAVALAALLALSLGAYAETSEAETVTTAPVAEETTEDTNTSEAYTVDTPIDTVRNDPMFGDYERLLFPVDEGYMSGDTLGDLQLTWYNNINPDKTVEICNYLHDEAAAGNVIFYPHGFGLGEGTVAEGWVDNAVAFWREHMTTEDITTQSSTS